MKFLKKLLKQKAQPLSDARPLQVVEINRWDKILLYESLGIEGKRASLLEEYAREVYEQSMDIVVAGEAVSKKCKHANELFFIGFALGSLSAQKRLASQGLFLRK